jgi:hypothetical protein
LLDCISIPHYTRDFGVGDALRDWTATSTDVVLFPHKARSFEPYIDKQLGRWFWPLRVGLSERQWFKKSQVQRGLAWFEYGHISREKFASELSIAYGEITTHNHFVLDRGGKVFNRPHRSSSCLLAPARTITSDYSGC